MRIMYFITGLTVGGAERITIDLAERMFQLGNKVILVFLTGKQEFTVNTDIDLINLKMRKNPIGFMNAILKASKLVRTFKPDVIHSNMFHANFFVRVLRLFNKIPRLICTEHSKNIQGKLRMKMLSLSDFLCDVTTNVSQEATDYFVEMKAFKKNKSIAVYNGIDLSKYICKRNYIKRTEYNINNDDFLFINVSRLMPAKDHENLIRAFNIVHKQNTKTKLICVGDGPEKEKIISLIKKLELKESIILAGNQSNVTPFYNMSDCFVLSSAWEGFGIVLAEAMSCELPVITTDCGGTKEVVQNEEFLVEPKNYNLLAEKMLMIMNLPEEKRKEIGKKNRLYVTKFDLNSVTQKWIELYSK